MKENKQKKSKILNTIERVGNSLPSPASLFFLLFCLVIVLSFFFERFGQPVTYETIVDGQLETVTVGARNLLSREGLVHILTTMISNFTGFFALGTVLTIMLGVGVADGSGLIQALMRRLALNTPKAFLSFVVVLLGILSNIASSTGYVVLVPLGAVLFMAYDRHPIAGLAAAFAGVSGGWSANLLIGSNDPMFAGISTAAAQTLNPSYVVEPIGNWYFMFVSTFIIAAVGAWVTDHIVEPRLGPYKKTKKEEVEKDISLEEKKGLKAAGITALALILVILLLTLPEQGLLRNPETGSLLASPFMSSIIVIMMLVFLLPGLAYGLAAGSIQSEKDLINLMEEAMKGLASFIVLIFFAAQFNSAFEYSNLGVLLSVNGAQWLSSVGFVGIPLILVFILLAAFINIFIAVDSAKWVMMAPIFIPMFMQLGISPELTQVAYRIGDSATNIIAPLMPFFVLTVAFFERYDEEAGIGSVVSTMLPYTLAFLLAWMVLLFFWLVFNLPLGPGAGLYY